MAMAPWSLSIDDIIAIAGAPTSGTYEVTSSGISFSTGDSWTYSGSGTFQGFSLTSGGSIYTDLEVGDTGNTRTVFETIMYEERHSYEAGGVELYSVTATSIPVEISYNNTTVASLSVPGSYAYLETSGDWIEHDITIECDPVSPNEVIVSLYNGSDEEMDTVYTATSEGTLTLNTEETWTPYNIKVFYGEPPGITIDGVTYTVDSTTEYWYEWVQSAYAPSGSSIETDPTTGNSYVHLGGTASNYGIYYNNTLESPGDEPTVGRTYTTAAAYEIHDLTGTTWYFNASPDTPFDTYLYPSSSSINFISNGVTYSTLSLDDYTMYYENTTAYGPQSGPPDWTSQNYRTISITGGSDVTNPSLYAFLSANATQTGVVVSFTVDGTTYWTPENTTWQTWCNSYLRISEGARTLVVNSGVPFSGVRRQNTYEPIEGVGVNGTLVSPSDIIVANTAYVKTAW